MRCADFVVVRELKCSINFHWYLKETGEINAEEMEMEVEDDEEEEIRENEDETVIFVFIFHNG